MFELDYKALKKGTRIFKIFLIVGIIIFIAFMVIIFLNIKKKDSLDGEVNASYIEINEHIDDEGDLMYSPIYHYKVGGKEYICESNFSSSTKPSDSGVVYYEKGNPSNCMTDYSSKSSWMFYLGLVLGAIFIIIGIIPIIKNSKIIKKAKYLSKNGKLIKGIPFTLENTNSYVNNHPIQKMVLVYELPNGLSKTYISNPRYDYDRVGENKVADLLIDVNNPDNYYIDFDIKYSGNVQVETYNGPVPTDNSLNQNNYNPEFDHQLDQMKDTVDKASEVVDKVGTLGNAASKIANFIGTGTITIGDDHKDDDN